MNSIKDYQVLAGTDISNLVQQVNAEIAKGWQPLVGVATAVIRPAQSNDKTGSITTYTQAMAR